MDNEKITLCTFYMADKQYGIDILHIKEINTSIDFTDIEHAPEEIKGYVNIRGNLYLIADLKKMLRIEHVDNNDIEDKIILFKSGVMKLFGILVDRIADTVEIKKVDIYDRRANESDENNEYKNRRKDKHGIGAGIVKVEDELNKKIRLEIKGAEAELDKGLVESLSDPMTHLIRNSCDHGIELPGMREESGKDDEGIITLNAYHDSGHINIEIKDDGAGIDPEKIASIALKKELKTAAELEKMSDDQKIRLIMMAGFSTKEDVSDLSGRGVGMDVVKAMIDKLGGSFELKSELGEGTTVSLRLPLTLAIVPSFIISMQNKIFAVPSINIDEIVSIDDVKEKIKKEVEWEVFQLRDKLIPIVYLKDILADNRCFDFDKRSRLLVKHDDDEQYPKHDIQVVILKSGKKSYGLVVDKVIGTEEIVVKPLHPLISNLNCFSGATIMGDGSVSMILNVEGIASHTGLISYEVSGKHEKLFTQKEENEKLSAVLFANSSKEIFAVSLSKLVRIEKFSSSRIEKIGNDEFISFDQETYGIVRLEDSLGLPEMEMQDEMYLFILKNGQKNMACWSLS